MWKPASRHRPGLSTQVQVVDAPRDPVRTVTRWAAAYCPLGGDVLEVGAGEHASGGLGPLRRRGAVIVGVDPDAALEHNDSLAERHRLSVEAFAADHAAQFDVVLSVFVLEHVEDPRGFANACSTVLRHGGSWFALTLNVHHYFGATAWAANRLGIKHAALHWLKGSEGAHVHRFPTLYRFNSRHTVEEACGQAGFSAVEFRVYDAPDRYAWYLPRPVDRLPALYSSMAYRIGSPGLMGHLSFRAERAA